MSQLGLGIALIVVLGLIPAIALIWVCIWLLFFYANDRTCWCTRRKRRSQSPDILEKGVGIDTNYQQPNNDASYDVPSGPYTARSTREPGSGLSSHPSSNSDPITSIPVGSRPDLRSHRYSSSSVSPVTQEPKQMV